MHASRTFHDFGWSVHTKRQEPFTKLVEESTELGCRGRGRDRALCGRRGSGRDNRQLSNDPCGRLYTASLDIGLKGTYARAK